MAVKARDGQDTTVREAAAALPERVRGVQGRVAAAVEASYLAQLGRDLRITVAQPAPQPCAGHGA